MRKTNLFFFAFKNGYSNYRHQYMLVLKQQCSYQVHSRGCGGEGGSVRYDPLRVQAKVEVRLEKDRALFFSPFFFLSIRLFHFTALLTAPLPE